MPKVWNMRDPNCPPDAIYIGRPSKWGNPFKITSTDARVMVIQRYKEYALRRPELLLEIKRELKGKDLKCWCAPKACHGDVLLEIANA